MSGTLEASDILTPEEQDSFMEVMAHESDEEIKKRNLLVVFFRHVSAVEDALKAIGASGLGIQEISQTLTAEEARQAANYAEATEAAFHRVWGHPMRSSRAHSSLLRENRGNLKLILLAMADLFRVIAEQAEKDEQLLVEGGWEVRNPCRWRTDGDSIRFEDTPVRAVRRQATGRPKTDLRESVGVLCEKWDLNRNTKQNRGRLAAVLEFLFEPEDLEVGPEGKLAAAVNNHLNSGYK